MTVPLATIQKAMPLRSKEWIWLYAVQTALQATLASSQTLKTSILDYLSL